LAAFGWLRLALNQRRESFDSSGVIRDVAAATTGGSGSGSGGKGSGTSPTRFDLRDFSSDAHVDVYSTGAEWEAHPAARVGTVLGGALNFSSVPDRRRRLNRPGWRASRSISALR
jgi:hypothetical protein